MFAKPQTEHRNKSKNNSNLSQTFKISIMNSFEGFFDDKEMQKLVTIYRNSEFNYVYVCCVCEQFSFTNIGDTLDHAESHFDEKTNITFDKNYEFVDISKVASEIIDETVIKTEYVEDASEVVGEAVDDVNRVESASEKQLECKTEPFFDDPQDYEECASQTEFVSKCKLCAKTFDAATLLIIHTINEHVKKRAPFTCPQCSQSSDNKFTYFTHVQKHLDEKEITCDVLIDKLLSRCKKTVRKQSNKLPTTSYQPKSVKTCDICLMLFPSRQAIYYHMRKMHISKPTFKCHKCNREIAGKFAFYAHHYGHLLDGDAVNDLDETVLEEKLHKFVDDNIFYDDSSDKKFGCKLCSHVTVYTLKSTRLHILQRHIHYVKRDQTRKFPCPHCHMGFAFASTLKVHLKVHDQDKQFACSICNKTFSQPRYVKTHEITHSDTKTHQCTICGSTFRTAIRLNYHMRTHSDVTAKCSICNKEVKKYRLKKHVQDVHENIHRPFSCSHCSLTFKTAKTLRNHAYRHTGERRFECRFHCKDKFVSSAARRAHERAKHEKSK